MRFLKAYKRLSELKGVPQVYYLTGSERYLKERVVSLVVEKVGVRRGQVVQFDPGTRVVEAVAAMSQTSMFDPVQVFVLSGLEKLRSEKAQEPLEKFLEDGPPQGHYVLLETGDTRRNPKGEFFEYLKETFEFVECVPLRESREEVSKWIRLCMERRGASLPDDVVRELAELCQGDLQTLESELTKLSLYPDPLTPEILPAIVMGSKEVTLQPLLEMLARQNGSKCLQRLTEVLEVMSLRQVVDGISKYLYRLLVVASMSQDALSNAEMADALGINPHYVKKLRAVSGRFSIFHLVVAQNRLAKIDTTVRLPGDSRPLLQSLLYFLCENPGKLVSKIVGEVS